MSPPCYLVIAFAIGKKYYQAERDETVSRGFGPHYSILFSDEKCVISCEKITAAVPSSTFTESVFGRQTSQPC